MSNLRASLIAALERSESGSSDYDLNPDVVLPPDRKLRPAGVLIAIRTDLAEPQVILTKRSSSLKHHPGQIAFPGGKQDDTDTDVVQTALREAQEEVGLNPDQVDVLGQMPTHETVTGFQVSPVLGLVSGAFDPVPEPGEVAEVFSAPLSFLMETANFSVEYRRWRGMRRHYYVVPFGPYYIWGATARMLRALAGRMER
ncbi:MAG: CoA pyrophosphatase [Paracoccaceae bacterium]